MQPPIISCPELIRSGIGALLVTHPMLDTYPIQAGPIHRNPTACPLVRVNPAIVGRDIVLEAGNSMVLLDVAASGDRALKVGSRFD